MGRIADGIGFAFEPRSVVSQPKAFGKVRGLLTPAEGVDVADARFRAANLQHVLANAVAEQLLLRDLGPAADYNALRRPNGLSADRVRRVFRGETAAQLADITYWATQFPEVGKAVADYIATWGGRASLAAGSHGAGVGRVPSTGDQPGHREA